MASYTETGNPVFQAFDSNGDPLSGGKLYTYAAGTTTPLATYTDSAGGTPNANPTILDSRGEAIIFRTVGLLYKFVLKTAADVTLWTIDNIGSAGVDSSAFSAQTYVAFTTGGTSTAYTLTPSPATTANTENQRFQVEFHTASGASPTLAVSGNTALNLKYMDASGTKQSITTNLITSGRRYDVVHDGTDWLVLGNFIPTDTRNRFINPAIRFDLEKEGGNYTCNSTGVTTLDAWTGFGTAASGVFTIARESGGINSGENNILATVTTNDASLAATDSYGLVTAIEGHDVSDLYSGSSSSVYVTVSFDVKCSITGTFSCFLQNSATDRSYPSQFTVNSANTVERKNITLRLDQSGTWLKDAGVGIFFGITFGAGSNFNGTLNTWGAGNLRHVSGSTNFMATNSNTMRLGNFDFYADTVSRAWKAPPMVEDFAKVSRYATKTFSLGTAAAQNSGTTVGALSYFPPVAGASQTYSLPWFYKAPMRAAPTITFYNPSAANAKWRNVTDGADSDTANAIAGGINSCVVYNNQVAGDGVNEQIAVHAYAQARLT